MAGRPSGFGALFVIVAGAWFFLQATVGELDQRLASYLPGGAEPSHSKGKGAAFVPAGGGGRALKVPLTVKRGDRIVYDTLMPVCASVGGGFVVISWHRPGALVKGIAGNPSCHRFGRGSGRGAMDIVHKSGKWEPVDALAGELKRLNAGEVIFRGDADHDPALGAKTPHCHAAVGCG